MHVYIALYYFDILFSGFCSADRVYNTDHYNMFRVRIAHDGTVDWAPGGRFEVSCDLDITLFPFDQQECYIKVSNWMYTGNEIILNNNSDVINMEYYTEDGEWNIASTQASSSYIVIQQGNYSSVNFIVKLKRKPMFYTMNVATPCILMSFLALLLFWLPPESGEKITLGLTVLLSFSVFLLLIADNVPKTSDTAPLIGKTTITIKGNRTSITLFTVLNITILKITSIVFIVILIIILCY